LSSSPDDKIDSNTNNRRYSLRSDPNVILVPPLHTNRRVRNNGTYQMPNHGDYNKPASTMVYASSLQPILMSAASCITIICVFISVFGFVKNAQEGVAS
jgi:hypothetical protein